MNGIRLNIDFQKVFTVVEPTSMRFENKSFDWEEEREGGGCGRAYIHKTELGHNNQNHHRRITPENHNLSFDALATELLQQNRFWEDHTLQLSKIRTLHVPDSSPNHSS